jgi:hypothetical protein
MDPASYPIYLMQLVGAFADSRGQVVGVPFKVGNGPTSVTIPAGAARLQLGANMWTYSDARDYYSPLNVSVSGPPPPVMSPVGSIPQLVASGPWKSTMVLVNSGASTANARLNFFDNSGQPMSLRLTFPESASSDPVSVSTLDRTLGAGAYLTMEGDGPNSQPTQEGWAQLVSDGSVSAFVVFGATMGDRVQEVASPLEARSAASYMLWFDNTGGITTGLALANLTAQPAAVAVTVRDDGGASITTDTVDLPAQGHTSFMLADRLALTSGRRGTVEFHAPAGGQISVLGLRFNAGAFTSVPVMAK